MVSCESFVTRRHFTGAADGEFSNVSHQFRRATWRALAFSIVAFCGAVPAAADEPLFGYVYTTDLLPKGKWEIEQWITAREGQANGHFHHIDMSTELEYGLSDNLQVSIYANYMYADESANSVRGLTEGIEIPWNHDPLKPYREARFDGFSFEAVYRVMSPYTDPFGLAFYIEPEIGATESGLELRAIAQKNFLDDRLVLAANIWFEFEREQGSNLFVPGSGEIPDGSKGEDTMAEFDLGLSYRFAPNWSAGLEFRNHNEFEGWTLNHSRQEHTAFFLGPNIHYAGERWFATLSVLRQIGAVTFNDEQAFESRGGLLFGDEHTRWDGIRLKFGYTFE